jgi:hypothetical protein
VWELVVPWLLSWFTDLYPLSALVVHQEFGLISIYPQRLLTKPDVLLDIVTDFASISSND